MDLQKHAEKLLKLAEQIEKEASDNTFFICSHCNHTASLAEVNDRRIKYAAQEDPELTVRTVTINDTVACPVPGCEGKMAYVATDTSEKYYTEGKESAADEPMLEDTVKEEKPTEKPSDEEPSGKKDDLDSEIDKLFEDVETQNAKSKQEKVDKVDMIQKARKEKKDKEQQTDLLGDPDKEKSETPKNEDPLSEPSQKTEPDPSAVKEDKSKEEQKLESKPDTEPDFGPEKEEKPKKKKEPVDLEKKDVPKFKSKQAAERYQDSCTRYTV